MIRRSTATRSSVSRAPTSPSAGTTSFTPSRGLFGAPARDSTAELLSSRLTVQPPRVRGPNPAESAESPLPSIVAISSDMLDLSGACAVGYAYDYKCYRSDDRYLVLLPDAGRSLSSLLCSLHSLRKLLFLAGDIELNPGPNTEKMLTELLAGQARIGQDIAALSAKVSSFDDRLTKLESLATSSKDFAQRLHELEQTVITLKSTIEKVDMKNDDLENRSRRNNLVIHGLLEPPQETPDTLLASVTGL
ncbi:hypothetical protein HPB50_021509 [Hyalomma asiaticum]|uniref:Uncharacterized protein n=1 Tax=Hyalomma asiaticum TaxID=266040 RepID=A0ACB7SM46_HYAAI|nr:hypothetical protein HPB50_021509 [Hyalomma asiaticum]